MHSISSLKEIKKGLVVIYNNEPCLVLEADFLRMQQAKPVMQTKLRSLVSGNVYKNNFKESDKTEIAELTKKSANFLYKDGSQFVFMDSVTYDQFSIDKEVLNDKVNFITENLPVNLLYWNDQLINVDLPAKVDLKVKEAEPGTRGDTAQGSVTKPATLETGYILQVPIFVKVGDVIKVNTDTGEYASRVNE